MQVVTLVIAILGLCTAVSSLTWNVVVFLLQGARPKVTALAGVVAGGGMICGPASASMVHSIRRTQDANPGAPLALAVEMVNRGRLPLHVYSLAVHCEPSKIRYVPGTADFLTGEFPMEISAGAKATVAIRLDWAAGLRYASEGALGKRQRIFCAVSSSRGTGPRDPPLDLGPFTDRTEAIEGPPAVLVSECLDASDR